MDYVLVTRCTSGKRLKTEKYLDAGNLPYLSQAQVSADWICRLNRGKNSKSLAKIPAGEVYRGRSITEVAKHKSSYFIVSAGLGLVESNTPIPGYNITTSGKHDQNIANRIDFFNANEWWNTVSSKSPFSSKSLNHNFSNKPILLLIALPLHYLSLVEDDLIKVIARKKTRVRIMSSIKKGLSPLLLDHMMPFDERINEALPGTASDFNQRAATLFIDKIFKKNPEGTLEEHQQEVNALQSKWAFPDKIKRKQSSIDDIKSEIRFQLNNPERSNYSASSMLRFFRDHLNQACEQKKFHLLFKEVKAEMGKTYG